MYFVTILSVYGVYIMVFCALSIAYRAVEDQDVGEGFGNRWYAVVIFVYTFVVSNIGYYPSIILVHGICDNLMPLPL